jgi:hypothetical protein
LGSYRTIVQSELPSQNRGPGRRNGSVMLRRRGPAEFPSQESRTGAAQARREVTTPRAVRSFGESGQTPPTRGARARPGRRQFGPELPRWLHLDRVDLLQVDALGAVAHGLDQGSEAEVAGGSEPRLRPSRADRAAEPRFGAGADPRVRFGRQHPTNEDDGLRAQRPAGLGSRQGRARRWRNALGPHDVRNVAAELPAGRCQQIHAMLGDANAMGRRTTAVLLAIDENGNLQRIAAGGARDFTPAQARFAESAGMHVAYEPLEHAEITALEYAQRRGWTTVMVTASRPICQFCLEEVVRAGGLEVRGDSIIFRTFVPGN